MSLPPTVLALSGWCYAELRVDGVLRSSLPASNAQATAKIVHLGDVPTTPLWCYGQAKLHQAQGRGLEPRPMEALGTQEGLGSQWCNRLPSISHIVGEEGVE